MCNTTNQTTTTRNPSHDVDWGGTYALEEELERELQRNVLDFQECIDTLYAINERDIEAEEAQELKTMEANLRQALLAADAAANAPKTWRTYSEGIVMALTDIRNPIGSYPSAIRQHMQANLPPNMEWDNFKFRMTVHKMRENGDIICQRNDSYKLPEAKCQEPRESSKIEPDQSRPRDESSAKMPVDKPRCQVSPRSSPDAKMLVEEMKQKEELQPPTMKEEEAKAEAAEVEAMREAAARKTATNTENTVLLERNNSPEGAENKFKTEQPRQQFRGCTLTEGATVENIQPNIERAMSDDKTIIKWSGVKYKQQKLKRPPPERGKVLARNRGCRPKWPQTRYHQIRYREGVLELDSYLYAT